LSRYLAICFMAAGKPPNQNPKPENVAGFNAPEYNA